MSVFLLGFLLTTSHAKAAIPTPGVFTVEWSKIPSRLQSDSDLAYGMASSCDHEGTLWAISNKTSNSGTATGNLSWNVRWNASGSKSAGPKVAMVEINVDASLSGPSGAVASVKSSTGKVLLEAKGAFRHLYSVTVPVKLRASYGGGMEGTMTIPMDRLTAGKGGVAYERFRVLNTIKPLR